MSTESERGNALGRVGLVGAPKGGTSDSATTGTVKRKATSNGVVATFDLSAWVGHWVTIRAETADIGWFARPSTGAGSAVDPSLTAVVGTNDGKQCARQIADHPPRPFFVEAAYPVVAVIGTGTGSAVIELADF